MITYNYVQLYFITFISSFTNNERYIWEMISVLVAYWAFGSFGGSVRCALPAVRQMEALCQSLGIHIVQYILRFLHWQEYLIVYPSTRTQLPGGWLSFMMIYATSCAIFRCHWTSSNPSLIASLLLAQFGYHYATFQCRKGNPLSSPIWHLPRMALSHRSDSVWHYILHCCFIYHPFNCLDVLYGPSENLPDQN